MINKTKAGRPKKKAVDKKKSFSVMITNRFRKRAIPIVREWVKEQELVEWVKEQEGKLEKETV
jgi:hypothetical protein